MNPFKGTILIMNFYTLLFSSQSNVAVIPVWKLCVRILEGILLCLWKGPESPLTLHETQIADPRKSSKHFEE